MATVPSHSWKVTDFVPQESLFDRLAYKLQQHVEHFFPGAQRNEPGRVNLEKQVTNLPQNEHICSEVGFEPPTKAVTYLASICHLFDQNGIVAEVGPVHGG